MAVRSASIALPAALVLAAVAAVSSFLTSAFVAPRAGARTQRTQLRTLITTSEPIFTYGEFPAMYDNQFSYGHHAGPIRGEVYAKYANWPEADQQTWAEQRT
eukprot:CAMPEP_0179091966 /NCGR_PEP_ID=MMETSP0796-20121207/42038_1 /TAXON_ID=73915 /ORGANISM="Pyrodinium bahamense, Strain pbaha01" /LENGTH=101 /DNA_ID=CAMNT_0020789565 /DNA_START=88 /DNA_END=390 /DNA_ORIENTATION=+